MAGELWIDTISGLTTYAILYDQNGQAADVVNEVFETIVEGEEDNYDTPLAEVGTTGHYAASMPAWVPAGVYSFRVRRQAGGGVDLSADLDIGGEAPQYWTGTAWRGLANLDAAITSRQPSGAVDLNADQSGVTVGTVNALSTAGIQAIFDTATSLLTTAGSIGKYFVDKLALITSGSITVTNATASDGSITIVAGDDYKIADSRQLEWSSSGWPDLTGATYTFKAVSRQDGTTFTGVTITGQSVGGATQIIQGVIEGDDTTALQIGAPAYNFAVKATLSDENEITLVRDTMTVQTDYTA